MKNALLGALLLVPLLLACAKADNSPALPTDGGCSVISSVPLNSSGLSPAEQVRANALFDGNRIDHQNFRFWQYQRDSLSIYPAPTRVMSEVVRVEGYANGLKIFTSAFNYIFWNGALHYVAGTPSHGVPLDTRASLTPAQLRGLFLATIARVDPTRTDVQNRCVSAEFGYYNLNEGTSSRTENFIKSWKVTQQGQKYPYAYYQDSDGQLIYYDNGIRTYR